MADYNPPANTDILTVSTGLAVGKTYKLQMLLSNNVGPDNDAAEEGVFILDGATRIQVTPKTWNMASGYQDNPSWSGYLAGGNHPTNAVVIAFTYTATDPTLRIGLENGPVSYRTVMSAYTLEDLSLGNGSPTVSITSPTNGATYAAPANITIVATAADSDGTVSNVAFYQGSTLFGSTNASPWLYAWANVTTGSYALKAVATDNLGAATTSSVVNVVVVVGGNSSPTVAITSPASGTTFTPPANITMTASASDSDGTVSFATWPSIRAARCWGLTTHRHTATRGGMCRRAATC